MRGQIVAVHALAPPIVTLEIRSIETIGGPAPLSAVVASAPDRTYVGSTTLVDPRLLGLGGIEVPPLAPSGIGAGPRPAGEPMRELVIPAGSRLRLVLTSPLGLPSPAAPR